MLLRISPPSIRSHDQSGFPNTPWCGGHLWQQCCNRTNCCDYPAVVGQVWMASDGTLALTVANTHATQTLGFTASMRVDRHMPWSAGGLVAVEDEEGGQAQTVEVGEKELHVTKTMAPLSAAVVVLRAK